MKALGKGNKKNKKYSWRLKTLIFGLVMVNNLLLLSAFIYVFMSEFNSDDITYAVEDVQEAYYEQDYLKLLDRIHLYDFYSDDMKVYREAGDAYVYKMQATIFKDGKDQAAYKEAVGSLEKMEESCQPENKELIGEFIAAVTE